MSDYKAKVKINGGDPLDMSKRSLLEDRELYIDKEGRLLVGQTTDESNPSAPRYVIASTASEIPLENFSDNTLWNSLSDRWDLIEGRYNPLPQRSFVLGMGMDNPTIGTFHIAPRVERIGETNYRCFVLVGTRVEYEGVKYPVGGIANTRILQSTLKDSLVEDGTFKDCTGSINNASMSGCTFDKITLTASYGTTSPTNIQGREGDLYFQLIS